MKDESEGQIIDEFVGSRIKNFYVKESNTAKGVNIATDFEEFKDNSNGNIQNQQNIIIVFL